MIKKLPESMRDKLEVEFEVLFRQELFDWKSKDIKDIDLTFDSLRRGVKKILLKKH